jgi:hypothetical protein
LYLTDFYNQAVVHNDTRGTAHGPANAAVRPDRDHYFGRIWRINHRAAKRIEVPDLAKANPAQLVKALQQPNHPVRMTAARLLVEGNDPATPKALQPLLASWNFRGLEEAQVHASGSCITSANWRRPNCSKPSLSTANPPCKRTRSASSRTGPLRPAAAS